MVFILRVRYHPLTENITLVWIVIRTKVIVMNEILQQRRKYWEDIKSDFIVLLQNCLKHEKKKLKSKITFKVISNAKY